MIHMRSTRAGRAQGQQGPAAVVLACEAACVPCCRSADRVCRTKRCSAGCAASQQRMEWTVERTLMLGRSQHRCRGAPSLMVAIPGSSWVLLDKGWCSSLVTTSFHRIYCLITSRSSHVAPASTRSCQPRTPVQPDTCVARRHQRVAAAADGAFFLLVRPETATAAAYLKDLDFPRKLTWPGVVGELPLLLTERSSSSSAQLCSVLTLARAAGGTCPLASCAQQRKASSSWEIALTQRLSLCSDPLTTAPCAAPAAAWLRMNQGVHDR